MQLHNALVQCKLHLQVGIYFSAVRVQSGSINVLQAGVVQLLYLQRSTLCSVLLVDMAFSCNFCSHGLVNLGKLGEGRVKALQRIWEEVKGANQHQHKSRILQQQCIRL